MKSYPLFLAASFVFSSAVLVSAQSQTQSPYRVNYRNQGQTAARRERLEASGFIGGMSVSHSLGTASNLYMTVTGSADNVAFGKFYGLRASWAFLENLAAEFNFSRNQTPYAFNVDDGVLGMRSLGEQFDATQTLFGGNVIYQYPLRFGLVPYATGGVGYLKTSPSNPLGDIADVTATDINFGGGVKYFLKTPRWLGLRFDVRYHTANDGFAFAGGDASPSGTEFTIGAIARFF